MKKIPFLSSILFAVYPIFFLYSNNLGKVVLKQLFLPVGIMLVLSFIFLFLYNLFLKNIDKSSLLVTIFFIMFFSYGQIYEVLDGSRFDSIIAGWQGYLLPYFTLLYIWIFLLIKITKVNLDKFLVFLNIISIALVLFASLNIAYYELGKVKNKDFLSDFNNFEEKNAIEKVSNRPSIYYIILDAYARNDILKEIYNYNNDDFINFLKAKGFFIGEKSSSNYCQSLLSLSSSLNMCYLDSVANYVGTESIDRSYLTFLLEQNNVMKFLKNYGYKTVAFSNGYTFTELNNADLYISPGFTLNEFWNALINFTPLSGFLNFINEHSQFTLHGEDVLFKFDKLEELSGEKYPKIVFAHIVSPHPPFIFNRNGMRKEFMNEHFSFSDGSHYIKGKSALKKEYIEGYKEQLIFITKKAKNLVDQILKNDNDAVIIIQSDHGPGSMLNWDSFKNSNIKERMSILNAIYLPDSTSSLFHKEITPVNTFRIILNRYFNQNYRMLKDESFFSTWPNPYKFIKTDTTNY